MNHPDRPEDPLLTSARRILMHEQDTTCIVKPWREIMAATKEQAKASKAAKAKAEAKGIKPYVHGTDTGRMSSTDMNPDEGASTQAAAEQSQVGAEAGVDSPPGGVIESGFSIFNSITQGTTMNALTLPQAQLDKEAAAKAKIQAKADKKAAAEKAAADKKAAAEAKAAEKAKLAEATKAEREAKAAEAKLAREAAAEKAKAEGKAVRERTYEGSMTALSERTRQGLYTKGVNGQLRTSDPLAVALETVPAKSMVALLMKILGLSVNPYPSLNYGQQSMNLRNRLRGAIRKEAKVEGTDVVISLARVAEFRDEVLAGIKAEAAAAAKAAEAPKTPAGDAAPESNTEPENAAAAV